MAANSAIEWTDATFNAWEGCAKVAAGCKNCYAENRAHRFGKVTWGPDGTRMLRSEKYWQEPIQWNAEAAAAGVRRRVFCSSLADVFEDFSGRVIDHQGKGSPTTLDDVRRRLFALIDATPWLDWLLVTKRPENILRMTPAVNIASQEQADDYTERGELYRRNVWLLTSVAEQKDADANAPELLKCRDLAPVLGLSIEPLIGAVDVSPWLGSVLPSEHGQSNYCLDGIDWVIVGGESGHGARPMHPDWARGLRDQCAAAGVPFFFKQWGEFVATDQAPSDCRIGQSGYEVYMTPAGDIEPVATAQTTELNRVGKKAAGRLLDGVTHDGFPSASTHCPGNVGDSLDSPLASL